MAPASPTSTTPTLLRPSADVSLFEGHAQNGARRETVPNPVGGARRALCGSDRFRVGSVEKPHGYLKRAVEAALLFETVRSSRTPGRGCVAEVRGAPVARRVPECPLNGRFLSIWRRMLPCAQRAGKVIQVDQKLRKPTDHALGVVGALKRPDTDQRFVDLPLTTCV